MWLKAATIVVKTEWKNQMLKTLYNSIGLSDTH